MFINRHLKKLFALVLTAAAVLVATQIGSHSVAAGAGRLASLASNQGNAHATPPILAPARGSRAQDGGAFSYPPPSHGRYSKAEMSAYASVLR